MPVKFLQLLNISGFILVITLNSLANALPINEMTTGAISNSYPNLFVPAGFTFAIWGVIYLLLLIFVIYQARSLWNKSASDEWVQTIGIWFFISCLANASWILAWHYLQVELSAMIMLVLLSSLILIYRKLRIGQEIVPSSLKYFVHLPFSVYLGWICVATIANFTTLFVHWGLSGFWLGETIWTALMVLTATAIGIIFLVKNQDLPVALVLIWTFYGIIANRFNSAILLTAWLGIALLGIIAIFKISRWIRIDH